MGAGRKAQTFTLGDRSPSSLATTNISATTRNLRKENLGGVVFGCKNNTMKECLSKQIFGLPSVHFSYVKKIEQGLPLFLFNYSDRKLHGIYEAAGPGQMNINPYGWTEDGSDRTPYPAQVAGPVISLVSSILRKGEDDLTQLYALRTIENVCSQGGNWAARFTSQDVINNLCYIFKTSGKQENTRLTARSCLVRLVRFNAPSIQPVIEKLSFKETASALVKGSTREQQISLNLLNMMALLGSHLFTNIVRICVRMQCQPLLEDQFSQILMDNYYSQYHFWFELDHAQTRALINSFSSSPVNSIPIPQQTPKVKTLFKAVPNQDTKTEVYYRPAVPVEDLDVGSSGGSQPVGAYSGTGIEDEEEAKVYLKLQQIALERQKSNCPPVSSPSMINGVQMEVGGASEGPSVSEEKNVEGSVDSSHLESVIAQLMLEMDELKNFSAEQLKKTSALEKKLIESETYIQQLNDRVKKLELKFGTSTENFDERSEGSSDSQPVCEAVDEVCSDADESILVVGGYNGVSWLSDLNSYVPSHDVMRSLKPMSSVRSYASAVTLNGHLYIFGGGNGSSWYDTVERYNPTSNEWTSCPPLIERKGSLAGATLDNKIFAIGGGNGVKCFWEVEMLDPALGRWVPTRSMLQKRFAPAAAELNGVLYAVGGYDGRDYLNTAERFDPREVSWTRLPSMNTRRGCHSLAILNEKVYALGGYDGTEMVSSVEIFDPRMGSWMTGDPINQPRGYSAAAIIGKSLYLIGGVYHGENILDTVERYTPGNGWEVTNLKGIGKRCFFSAVVL